MKTFCVKPLVFFTLLIGSSLPGFCYGFVNPVVERKLELGVSVRASSRVSMDKVDHSTWDKLLQKFVNENGGVDYASWNSSQQDIRLLDQYLATLSTATKSNSSRNGRMAFWINAYNAVTVKGILQEYPTSSIRNHTGRLFGYNIWKQLLLHVDGKKVSLDAIEHQILRPMKDPRIHFAIVCASKGCPRLLNRAYLPESLSNQLDNNARNFFSQSQNFQYSPVRKQFRLSSILSWFGTDFGSSQVAQLNSIATYLPTAQAKAAARSNSVSVTYLEYDWSLNEQINATALSRTQNR
ncbi:MAG: DUF547 domain-containing protein [Planctomycetota bacterium]